jgi:hypothetical protein
MAALSVDTQFTGDGGPGRTIWQSSTDTVVTTAFFGFGDTTDHFKLQGLGQVCSLGDAMVGDVPAAFPDVQSFSIRNASGPQVSNPNNDIRTADRRAGEINATYGPFTTAASVTASWAVISAACNANH